MKTDVGTYLKFFFSVSDILLDYKVFYELIRGSETLNDTLCEEKLDVFMGNFLTKICNMDGKETSITYNPWFTIHTLLYIYLPSVNVMATLYGPETIGRVAKRTGFIIAIIGAVLATVGFYVLSPITSVIGWFLLFFGGTTSGLGWINKHSGCNIDVYRAYPSILHYIFFFPLLILAPAIFIFIKFMAIIKEETRFLKSQSSYGSRGEAILEAAPQLGLQIYITLLTMKPSVNQKLSILTSAATISFPIIETYVSARGMDLDFKSIMQNFLVFLPSSLFKVASVSIMGVFMNGWAIPLIMSIIIIELVCLLSLEKFHDIGPAEVSITSYHSHENGGVEETLSSYRGMETLAIADRKQQFMECIFLSWMTLTNLGNSKRAAVYRVVSTFLITVIYSVILTVFLIICNTNVSDGYTFRIHETGITWSELPLVSLENGLYVNLILGLTICMGWVSFLLDLVTAALKIYCCGCGPVEDFWDNAVLLEAFKYRTKDKRKKFY